MAADPAELGRRLRDGDRSAAAAALNVIENRAEREATRALLAELSPAALGGEPATHVVGITGPPGAGKSLLLSALAPAFDVVVIETVGVGQSETDVEDVCDTVAVVVQPASGDVLQFLKAGIMEVPDVLVVTKADLGDAARRAQRDLEQALAALGSHEVPVLAVSSVSPPSGITELADALDAHRDRIDVAERRLRARRASALREFTAEHGEGALRALGGRREAERLLATEDPSADVSTLIEALRARA